MSRPDDRPSTPSEWPADAAARVVFLLDAVGALERKILDRWIEAKRPGTAAAFDVAALASSRAPRQRLRVDGNLEALLSGGDDPVLAPLRVIWLSPSRNGDSRVPGLLSLLLLGDPYDPSAVRRHWILRRSPERCRVVAGEPARLSELRERWRRLGGTDGSESVGLADFVSRQAALALERAERRVRGMRYKVPRFVHESILERSGFQGALARLAWETGKDVAAVRHEAHRYLSEIAATHSPYMIDLTAHICRLLYSRAYARNLRYDRAQLERIYALAQRHPVCFLPSHRSNLDHLVLQVALYENGHPPNHTAGGINMNFFPMGPLFRRSGVFFIRRTFKDNDIYKTVLRHYVDYLIEKRFPIEWYIEGGRSRSGKLLPPRFGLLAYVVDAYRRAKSEDVILVPVSITYDQIQDVGSYVAEQQGGEKEREGFGWFLRVFRSLRRRYGAVHIRFGEPLSLRESLGGPEPDAEPSPDEQNLDLQKLAFEVSARINRVTPFTPTAMVTLASLAAGDRALTVDETVASLEDVDSYARKRQLPVTDDMDLSSKKGVERALEALGESGVVTCYSGGPEAVYAIGADQHLTAAYYRNTVAHFFVPAAIAELSLVKVAEDGIEDRERAFWNETMRLRDLLKFEFFFSEKEAFRREISAEASLHDPDWTRALAAGPEPALALLKRFRPFSAHLVLRPFLEAYQVVADVLLGQPSGEEVNDDAFLTECLGLGKQYRLQHRIRSSESISKVLFGTALRLARNRQLVPGVAVGGPEARRAFAEEIRDVIRRIDAVDALAAARRAGIAE